MPESKASSKYVKNNRRKRRDSTRTGKKKRGRQEIHRVPSREIPPPGDDTMEVGMKKQVLSPTMEYGKEADFSS